MTHTDKFNNTSCSQPISDEEVLKRVQAGETHLYEIITRRYNQRLHRTTRKILRTDAEVEDVVQEAHILAFAHLSQFNGRSSFSTWLTRIAINRAFTRLRAQPRFEDIDQVPKPKLRTRDQFALATPARDPEQQLLDKELRRLLNTALAGLPSTYRKVFILREVEEMSTAETVSRLRISEACAKSRLHRARALLRDRFHNRLKSPEQVRLS
jgi:RNA polymerase sigma-70 factor (ECF subfamily)